MAESLVAISPSPVMKLDAAALARVTEIEKEIDITDSQAIIQYGVGAQKEISNFSDTVLNTIRNKDSGYVGEILSDLVVKVKDLDVDGLTAKGGFFTNLFGALKARFTRFMAKYEKLSVQIEHILDELDKARMQLLKDITLLDAMYDKNVDYLHDLDLYIIAGTNKLKELNDKVLPELQDKAGKSGDPMDAQNVRDFMQLINRFEKKLHDLKLSRTIAIQTGPQLRIIQANDNTLVEKIQSSILNTIPLWKNQIVIAISLYRQADALKLQKEVTDTTNELLQKNSQMLHDNSIAVATETERGIVDLETLKKVNADLISTIEETLRIQADGRVKRAQAEQDLAQMERDLKAKLTEVPK
jgi:uncharacterized protein YaaN involved in tellurite resistance